MLKFLTSIAMGILMLSSGLRAQVGDVPPMPPIAERGLKVRVEMLKPSYLVAEPVFFYAWIENSSAAVQYYRIEEVREFQVVMADGSRLPQRGGWPAFQRIWTPFIPGKGNSEWLAMEPLSSTEKLIFNALEFYGNGMAMANFVLPTGEYRVFFRDVPTDTADFRVVRSEDLIEAAIGDAIAAFLEDPIAWVDTNVAFPFYEEQLRRGEATVYKPRLLLEIAALRSVVGPRASGRQYYRRLLTECPTSPIVGEALSHFLGERETLLPFDRSDRDEVIRSLETVKLSFPKTPMARVADSLLNILGE